MVLDKYYIQHLDIWSLEGQLERISLFLSIANNALPLMQDMIHVVESKSVKRFGDYFLRQIVKVWCIYSSHTHIYMFA